MKAKTKKILTIVWFGIAMTALAYSIYFLCIGLVLLVIDSFPVLDFGYAIAAAVVMCVFLGLYLSYKPKKRMF